MKTTTTATILAVTSRPRDKNGHPCWTVALRTAGGETLRCNTLRGIEAAYGLDRAAGARAWVDLLEPAGRRLAWLVTDVRVIPARCRYDACGEPPRYTVRPAGKYSTWVRADALAFAHAASVCGLHLAPYVDGAVIVELIETEEV